MSRWIIGLSFSPKFLKTRKIFRALTKFCFPEGKEGQGSDWGLGVGGQGADAAAR